MDRLNDAPDAQERIRLNQHLMQAHGETLAQGGFDKEEIERLIALRARVLTGHLAWG